MFWVRNKNFFVLAHNLNKMPESMLSNILIKGLNSFRLIFFNPKINEKKYKMICYFFMKNFEIIRIYHECEGMIEQSVPRVAVWHHEA